MRCVDGNGLIPACAGSTNVFALSCLPNRAHPRMRGEYSQIHRVKVHNNGLIPACAGSIQSSHRSSERDRDHPRMRGEYLKVLVKAFLAPGSSPRARGIRDTKKMSPSSLLGSYPHARGVCERTTSDERRARLIPAHAGNTLSLMLNAKRVRAHPRTRGEYT